MVAPLLKSFRGIAPACGCSVPQHLSRLAVGHPPSSRGHPDAFHVLFLPVFHSFFMAFSLGFWFKKRALTVAYLQHHISSSFSTQLMPFSTNDQWKTSPFFSLPLPCSASETVGLSGRTKMEWAQHWFECKPVDMRSLVMTEFPQKNVSIKCQNNISLLHGTILRKVYAAKNSISGFQTLKTLQSPWVSGIHLSRFSSSMSSCILRTRNLWCVLWERRKT